nr:reverse transcriptase domain-containing protein [Tanacetum cinerariifolium]
MFQIGITDSDNDNPSSYAAKGDGITDAEKSLSRPLGQENPMVIEAEVKGHLIDRFSGEISWPLGQISLMVSLGDGEYSTNASMNFMVVRSPSPYNGIIGHMGLRKIQAVPSTAHGMLKFPPIRQKTRGHALDRNKAIQEEVAKLVEAEIVREVHYHDWISYTVMAHPVAVITYQPIKQILSRSKNTERMLKWKFKLEAFDITNRPRMSIRDQVLADFIAERPDEEGPPMEAPGEEVTPESWTLFIDGSSCLEGLRVGLILTSPKGEEFTYTQRFEFDASNKEAEYEALVAGLQIVKHMGYLPQGIRLMVSSSSNLLLPQRQGFLILLLISFLVFPPEPAWVHGFGVTSSAGASIGGPSSSGLSAIKSAKTWSRIDILGLLVTSNASSLNFHFNILPVFLDRDRICLMGWYVITATGCAWKYRLSLLVACTSAKTSFC